MILLPVTSCLLTQKGASSEEPAGNRFMNFVNGSGGGVENSARTSFVAEIKYKPESAAFWVRYDQRGVQTH